MGVYDQFIWFGDSLTQQAWGGQEGGFGAGAAVQNCEFVGRSFFSYNSHMEDWVSLVDYHFPPLEERVEFCGIFLSKTSSFCLILCVRHCMH